MKKTMALLIVACMLGSFSVAQAATECVYDVEFGVLLKAVLKQLRRAGFRIVVAHGHGPSTMFFANNSEQYRQEFGLEKVLKEALTAAGRR